MTIVITFRPLKYMFMKNWYSLYRWKNPQEFPDEIYKLVDCGIVTFGYAKEKMENIRERLEYLRGEIETERISYDEIMELQSLAEYIEPGDTILLEWAGVPENE